MLVCITQLFTYSTIMEFITTQKGGQCLLWHGCRFVVNRKMDNGRIHLRCFKRTCPAKITTQLSFLSFLFMYLCLYLHTSLENYLDYHILDILGHGSKCLDIMGLGIRHSGNNPHAHFGWIPGSSALST